MTLSQQARLPAKQAGGQVVQSFFSANKDTLAAVLPKHVTPERMMKLALGALRTTPALMECTTQSLFGAVVQCAQLGLEPNTPMGHAYLIPFNKKSGDKWVKDVNVVLGYRGLIDLARRSGQIVSLTAHEVCAKDHFEYGYGLADKLEHRPAMDDRGAVIAFYAVAHLKGGGHAYEIMSVAQVNKIRDDAAIKNGAKPGADGVVPIKGPWKDHYVEMGRKTALRRLFKYLPVSIELATAVALDGMAEGGKRQGMADVLNGDFVVMESDDDDTGGNDQPPTPTLPTLSDAEFDKKLHGWADMVAAGDMTPDDIITTASTRNTLSDAQISEIRKLGGAQ